MGQNKMLEIRRAETSEDIRRIADLAAEIWKEHFTPIIGAEQVAYMVDKFQSERALGEQLAGGYEYYQLWLDGRMAGYTGIHPEQEKLFLSKLYLHKDFRGRHLATETVEFLKNFARDRGMKAIWLTCNRHNSQTLAVYHHLGFRDVRTQVADIGNGFVMDDYILELPIC